MKLFIIVIINVVYNLSTNNKKSQLGSELNSILSTDMNDQIRLYMKFNNRYSSVLNYFIDKQIPEKISKDKLYKPLKKSLYKLYFCYDSNLKFSNQTYTAQIPRELYNELCYEEEVFLRSIVNYYLFPTYDVYNLEYNTVGNSLLFSSFIYIKKNNLIVEYKKIENFINFILAIQNLYKNELPFNNNVRISEIIHKLIYYQEKSNIVRKVFDKLDSTRLFKTLLKIISYNILGLNLDYENILNNRKLQSVYENLKKTKTDVNRRLIYSINLLLIDKYDLNSIFFSEIEEYINIDILDEYIFLNNTFPDRNSYKYINETNKVMVINNLIHTLDKSFTFRMKDCNSSRYTDYDYNSLNEVNYLSRYMIETNFITREMKKKNINYKSDEMVRKLYNILDDIIITLDCPLKLNDTNLYETFYTRNDVDYKLIKSSNFTDLLKDNFERIYNYV
jgi:hypothetical protein